MAIKHDHGSFHKETISRSESDANRSIKPSQTWTFFIPENDGHIPPWKQAGSQSAPTEDKDDVLLKSIPETNRIQPVPEYSTKAYASSNGTTPKKGPVDRNHHNVASESRQPSHRTGREKTQWTSQSSASTLVDKSNNNSNHSGSSEIPVPSVSIPASRAESRREYQSHIYAPTSVSASVYSTTRSPSPVSITEYSDDDCFPGQRYDLDDRIVSGHMDGLHTIMTPATIDKEPEELGLGSETKSLDVGMDECSSPAELQMLWEAANGQLIEHLPGTLKLCMARTNLGTFTFGNTRRQPPLPFYTMHRHPMNEITITRTNPSNPHNIFPVITLDIEPPTSTTAGGHHNSFSNDLVTLIIPQLASMLAMEQADERSRSRSRNIRRYLSPSTMVPTGGLHERQQNAPNGAPFQEACLLTRNRVQGVYELQNNPQRRPALVAADGIGIALSPVQSRRPRPLNIIVSSTASGDRYRYHHNYHSRYGHPPPTIIVTASPGSIVNCPSVQGANGSSTTLSTIPLPTDIDESTTALASLDLGSRTLSLSPAVIAAAFPSPYAIDSLIAAILAVAVSDDATLPFLEDMQLQLSRPQGPIMSPSSSPSLIPSPSLSLSLSLNSLRENLSQYPRPTTLITGNLITSLADHEEDKQATEMIARVKTMNNNNNSTQGDNRGMRSRSLGFLSKFTRSKKTKTKTKNEGRKVAAALEDLDLEKYARYGPGSSREGEELPVVTRGLLAFLFWGFEMTVHGLAMMARALAWVLVSVTRFVTCWKV